MSSSLKNFVWLLIGLCFLPVSCNRKDSAETSGESKSVKVADLKRIEAEYELIQAELFLARAEKPYLVLDLSEKTISIKLKGAIVWKSALEILESESDGVGQFSQRFLGSEKRPIRFMTGKHLFASSDKTPDSVLAVVGKVVKVDPELLQREMPERFQLHWDRSLILEIRTELAGKPTSRLKNMYFEIKRALQRPFGEAYIAIKISPEEALTLYRVSQPGLPTLLKYTQ